MFYYGRVNDPQMTAAGVRRGVFLDVGLKILDNVFNVTILKSRGVKLLFSSFFLFIFFEFLYILIVLWLLTLC